MTVKIEYPALPSEWFRFGDLLPRDLPNTSAVYFLLDSNFLAKYVGETTRLSGRFGDHRKGIARARDIFGWVDVQNSLLIYTEAWFISLLRPYKNTRNGKGPEGKLHSVKVDALITPIDRRPKMPDRQPGQSAYDWRLTKELWKELA